jgi:hypothetical protein
LLYRYILAPPNANEISKTLPEATNAISNSSFLERPTVTLEYFLPIGFKTKDGKW